MFDGHLCVDIVPNSLWQPNDLLDFSFLEPHRKSVRFSCLHQFDAKQPRLAFFLISSLRIITSGLKACNNQVIAFESVLIRLVLRRQPLLIDSAVTTSIWLVTLTFWQLFGVSENSNNGWHYKAKKMYTWCYRQKMETLKLVSVIINYVGKMKYDEWKKWNWRSCDDEEQRSNVNLDHQNTSCKRSSFCFILKLL